MATKGCPSWPADKLASPTGPHLSRWKPGPARSQSQAFSHFQSILLVLLVNMSSLWPLPSLPFLFRSKFHRSPTCSPTIASWPSQFCLALSVYYQNSRRKNAAKHESKVQLCYTLCKPSSDIHSVSKSSQKSTQGPMTWSSPEKSLTWINHRL